MTSRFFSLRRACLCAMGCLLMAGYLSRAAAQTAEAPLPVPALWQGLGISTWPVASPDLALLFDEIVLPGVVPVRLRSKLQFTQKLVLFAQPPGAPEAMTQLASFALSSKSGPQALFSYQASATRNLILLAQTPSGWFMVERQLKVGHKQ